MSRGSWANRNDWGDRNSYMFGVNSSYFTTSLAAKYIPLAGSTSEGSASTDVQVQFSPGNSGRLVSLSIYSSASTAPGDTTALIKQNGSSIVLGRKQIEIPSQTLTTFNFRDELTSGTFEWNINTGTSIAIQLNPLNQPDTMNVFLLFEIYL